MTTVTVPQVFIMRPFYEINDKIMIDDTCEFLKDSHDSSYWFYEDILAYLQIETSATSPWLYPANSIQKFLDKWNNKGELDLNKCFEKRNRAAAKPLMQQYTASYLQMMQWVKQKPLTHLVDDYKALTHELYAPVNLSERLSFVFNSIDHYHAFTTLRQLIEESEKKWAVYLS
ncbi:hypothetical protein HXA34_10025 [Salipaludibacillus agaradhaerens]|uniref:YpoC family protein n=1 Tax=Salipaludibacillus agaradhaerens TaxID=76935 RepID=UPI002150E2B8|nr:hypothetical protein [Salipaludibacillus agaradhaerens]MCR6106620.1 hypothetical protein [Salipaludibacillus agaradhaerens]MCR6118653.1 hypothetical protein [Salipaludibacillus agaradhaerens]UJW57735.1 hypothetical protein HXZ66_10150 [Bacillus sp. A116_S68]